MYQELRSFSDFSSLNISWPKVTVLVLAFNHEDYIAECLTGLATQNARESMLVLIHDDASTDKTVSRIRDTVRELQLPTVAILQSENQFSMGRNITSRILEHVKSPYVAYCEGDDYWVDPNKLRMQSEFLDANPNCGVVHTAVRLVSDEDSNEAEPSEIQAIMERNRGLPAVTSGTSLANGNYISMVSAMHRRANLRNEVLRLTDGLRPTDWILHALASEQSDIGFISDVTASYRLHRNNSWSGSSRANQLQRLVAVHWFLAGVLKTPARYDYQRGLLASLGLHSAELLGAPPFEPGALQAAEWMQSMAEKSEHLARSYQLELAAALSVAQAADARVEAIEASRSWRITAPLRRLTRKRGEFQVPGGAA